MVSRTNFVPNCWVFRPWLNFRGILCSSVFLLFRGICRIFSTNFWTNRLVFDGDYFAKLRSEREVGEMISRDFRKKCVNVGNEYFRSSLNYLYLN